MTHMAEPNQVERRRRDARRHAYDGGRVLLLLMGGAAMLMTLTVLTQSPPVPQRAARVAPIVAALGAHQASALAAAHPPIPALPRERVELMVEGGTLVHVYPPMMGAAAIGAGASTAAVAAAAPVVWMLHGMCMDPLRTCDSWSQAARSGAWLVCPSGNARCGDRSDWSGAPEARARHLDSVRQALDDRFGEHVASPGRDVLMGFSRGAFVARDVVYVRPGWFSTLVLIGAALVPDPATLKSAGIEHVLLASGDFDGARPTMVSATSKLVAAGLDARFEALGPVWHQMPPDMTRFVTGALQWSAAGS
jgi:predicted esterase